MGTMFVPSFEGPPHLQLGATDFQEVLCDLVFVDSILRLTDASVVLHVKDAPVFVSDVTEKDRRRIDTEV